MIRLRNTDGVLAAGRTIGGVCHDLAVGEQTFHRWRHICRGKKTKETKRFKDSENENQCRKKLLAGPKLDEVIVSWPSPPN